MSDRKQSYAESLGLPHFDWRAFLNQEEFTEEEIESIKVTSMDWEACACGMLPKEIERYQGGAPEDGVLMNLGCIFAGALNDFYFAHSALEFEAAADSSLACLDEIEARAEELLNPNKKN